MGTEAMVVEAAAPHVPSFARTTAECDDLVKKLVPDPDTRWTRHVYRGAIYKNPPMEHAIDDKSTEVSREMLHDWVSTGLFEGLPVLLEHNTKGDRPQVGRIVRASYNAPDDQFEVEFRMAETNENSAEILHGIQKRQYKELSLGHIVYSIASGVKRPIEVSITEQGARPGCILINASALQAARAKAEAEATAAAAPGETTGKIVVTAGSLSTVVDTPAPASSSPMDVVEAPTPPVAAAVPPPPVDPAMHARMASAATFFHHLDAMASAAPVHVTAHAVEAPAAPMPRTGMYACART